MAATTAPLLAVAAQWPHLQYHGLISQLQHELVTGRIDAKQARERPHMAQWHFTISAFKYYGPVVTFSTTLTCLLGHCDSNKGLLILQAWSRLCQERLRPDQPFEMHRQLYAAIYDSWQTQLYGPAPVWIPQQQDINSTNLARFMSTLEVGSL